MGGCATKPKELNGHPPAENPSTPELLAKSVDLPAAPAPAVEVKAEADGDNEAEKETGGEAPADNSESKPEAEQKTEPAAAAVGKEPGAPEEPETGLGEAKQDAPMESPEEISDEGKLDLPKFDENVDPEDTTKQADEKTEAQKASAGETTDEAKRSVDESSPKEGSAAASSSGSA